MYLSNVKTRWRKSETDVFETFEAKIQPGPDFFLLLKLICITKVPSDMISAKISIWKRDHSSITSA